MSTGAEAGQAGIVASGVTVRRGDRLLVEQLSFALAPGDVLLLTGPNGAGKSSLLLAICGELRPAAGSITISGADADVRAETALHYVGHAPAVKRPLSAAENLGFWADFYGGSGAKVASALETVGLGGLDALPAGYLSAGQTRRLALARLLVAPRPIWLLDEPTAALDTEGSALVARLVSAHAQAGGIAIVATHEALALAVPARTIQLGGTR